MVSSVPGPDRPGPDRASRVAVVGLYVIVAGASLWGCAASPSSSPTPSGPPSGATAAQSAPATPSPPTVERAGTYRIPAWTSTWATATARCRQGLLALYRRSDQPAVLRSDPDGGVGTLTLVPVGQADVNHDGSVDQVAKVVCAWGEADPAKVVAFTPAGNATFDGLGTVVEVQDQGRDAIAVLETVAPGLNGSVTVQVGDLAACCGTPAAAVTRQWRTYSWTPTGFRQTDGPTTFFAGKARGEVALSSPGAVPGAPVEGRAPATLAVTVANHGANPAPNVLVLVLHRLEVVSLPAQCGAYGEQGETTCAVGTVEPGKSLTLTFHFRLDYGQEPQGAAAMIQARSADFKYADAAYVNFSAAAG